MFILHIWSGPSAFRSELAVGRAEEWRTKCPGQRGLSRAVATDLVYIPLRDLKCIKVFHTYMSLCRDQNGGVRLKCYYAFFPDVLWLWHFLYNVVPYPVSSLQIFTFVVSRAFMAGVASQARDADSSGAPGLTFGLQGSVNVHRGALLLLPQWQCISSLVFYIFVTLVSFAVWSW